MTAALQVLAQLNDFADDQRRTGKRFAHRPLTALVALGEFDFALAREQRNGAHLAQVHADRIVGFVANILGQFQVAEIVRFVFGGFFEVELLGFFEDFDAGAVEVCEKILKLAPGREIFGEQLVDFVVENEPFFFARVHEIFQPAEFVICSHWRPVYQRTLSEPAQNGTWHPLRLALIPFSVQHRAAVLRLLLFIL